MIKSKLLFGVLAATFLLAAFQRTNVNFKSGRVGGLNSDGIDISAQLFKPEGKGPYPAVVLHPLVRGIAFR
jgi:hypothetical protein